MNCLRCNRDITMGDRVWLHTKPWPPRFFCVPCHNRIMRARERRRLAKERVVDGKPEPT